MKNKEALIQQIHKESNQSDLIYQGKSCVSSQLDAGWQAEKHASRAMAYRMALLDKPWQETVLHRLNSMKDKMNLNGKAVICQTADKPASSCFMSELSHSKTWLVTDQDVQNEIKYISKVLSRCGYE